MCRGWCCGRSRRTSTRGKRLMAREHFGGGEGVGLLLPSQCFGVSILPWAPFPRMKGWLVSLSFVLQTLFFLEVSDFPSGKPLCNRKRGQKRQGVELEDSFQVSSVWLCPRWGHPSDPGDLVGRSLPFEPSEIFSSGKVWLRGGTKGTFCSGIFQVFLWEAVERGGWEGIAPGWLDAIIRQISPVV